MKHEVVLADNQNDGGMAGERHLVTCAAQPLEVFLTGDREHGVGMTVPFTHVGRLFFLRAPSGPNGFFLIEMWEYVFLEGKNPLKIA